VIKVGIDAQIPVFASDTDSVERGAIAAIGHDHHQLGRQTGEIVVRILKGEKPGTIDVQTAQGTDLYINTKMAGLMGVDVPASLLSRATKIIK